MDEFGTVLLPQCFFQSPCGNIDVEICSYFAPVVAHLVANQDVIGMAVLGVQALLCHLHIAEPKEGIFLMNINDHESIFF